MKTTKEFYFGGIKKVSFNDKYDVFAECGGIIEHCGPVAGTCVESVSLGTADCISGTKYYCVQTWYAGEYYGSLATAGTC